MKVITEILGGLGNQLFAYCLGYAVASGTNAELYIDTSRNDSGFDRELELLKLNVPCDGRLSYKITRKTADRILLNALRRKRSVGVHTKYYYEKEIFHYDPQVFAIQTDTLFRGYWQSASYFTPYKTRLNDIIRFPLNTDLSYCRLLEEAKAENAVAVHVRRGDYLNFDNHVLPASFYTQAVSRMEDLANRPLCYYIFSDDMVYCRSFFAHAFPGADIRYPEYDSADRSIDDLHLMSRFDKIIIANSTFSWWAAFLGNEDKTVICPAFYCWDGEYYEKDWIRIHV